jgi:hypothetical protein
VAAACSLAAAARGTFAEAQSGVRAGTTVTPDTVTVGDPFVVQVRVAAPAGARVRFPSSADSGAAVGLLDPPREARAAGPDGSLDVTAVYRAAAWDVGVVPVGLGDVVVALPDGAERRVSLAGLRVVVRSVLPADSARRVPRAVRDPVPDPGRWWLPWALAAAALLAMLALLVWLARRGLRTRRGRAPADLAYQDAQAAFARVDALQLVSAGEGGRHLALSADVARDYLVARIPGAERAHTTGELLDRVATSPDVPADAVAALLADADLVKFAAARVSPAAAESGGAAARGLVDAVEASVRARLAREAEESAAAERSAREARRRYEEERRRAAARRGGPPPAGGPPGGDGQERAA